ncbi:class I glutamine amidotransferase-like protein [Dipodascopsis uninucleata]
MSTQLFRSFGSVKQLFKASNSLVIKYNYADQRLFSSSRLVCEKAFLTIKNGPVYEGNSFGALKDISGEAVFTTSLVGYPESMTDPSYRGQILVFTQPLIGNYGVPSMVRDEFNLLRYFESSKIQCAGIVVTDVAQKYSHWTAVESISEWCQREGVAAITGVDTRSIVRYLREQGSSLAKITIGQGATNDEYDDPSKMNLVEVVSTKEPYTINPGKDIHIAVIDCGVKENIVRCLVSRGATTTVFPSTFAIQDVASQFDGIFISNGPGDPTQCMTTVRNLKQTMDTYNGPIFGICLGHQLLALAVGAKTVKLKYGNRAHNIPTLDVTTGQCHITSQNHGYAVDITTLPSEFKEYFVNLNDRSNEGMIHVSRPIFSTQFHPEAKGGPLDSSFLFDKFLENIRIYKAEKSLLGSVKSVDVADATVTATAASASL